MTDLITKYLDSKPKDVLKQCETMWDWSSGIPFPRWDMKCLSCGGEIHTLHIVHFHVKNDSPHRFRCRLSFKCSTCSAANNFGVVIPEELAKQHNYQATYFHNDLRLMLGLG